MKTVELIMQLQSRRGGDQVLIYDPVTERYLDIDFVDFEAKGVGFGNNIIQGVGAKQEEA